MLITPRMQARCSSTGHSVHRRPYPTCCQTPSPGQPAPRLQSCISSLSEAPKYQGLPLHRATYTALVCACAGSQLTQRRPGSALRHGQTPARRQPPGTREQPQWSQPLTPTTTGTSAKTYGLILHCWTGTISSSQAQDRHQQAQPQALVHAEVSMTRSPSWPKPERNQWEEKNNSESHLRIPSWQERH